MSCLLRMNDDVFSNFLKARYTFVDNVSAWWQQEGFTAIVTPFWPAAPPKIDDMHDLALLCEYSGIWNTTGFPAGVMPVTTVKANEQSHSDIYNDKYTQALDRCNQNSEGLPIHIQVVGHAYEDEKVLAIMQMLENKIGHIEPVNKN